VLDFARGRLGGGLTLQRENNGALEQVLLQVIAELQSSNPDRVIETDIGISRTFECDSNRIGQLVSNLVGNALMYGTVGSPIHVRAATEADKFVLWVSNAGTPIPAEAMERLFHPFKRGAAETHHQGLGLGLYIASEIAKAHGGRIDVVSTAAETRFTFAMPI
jgi:sigma-B regulation protein RsbU (phosphoserine phosphatase)